MKKSIIAVGLVTVVGASAGLSYAKSQIEHKVGHHVFETINSQEAVNQLKNGKEELTTRNVLNVAASSKNETPKTLVDQSTSKNTISHDKTSVSTGNTVSKSVGKNKIRTVEEAIKFAESRIPESEELYFLQLYNNRNNLTKEQKQAAKEKLLSYFTPEEIAMLKQVVKKN